MNLLVDTDTSSIERRHSLHAVNTKLASTNKVDVAELSDVDLMRRQMNTGFWRLPVPPNKPEVPSHQASICDDGEEPITGGGGGWRALLHCRLAGTKFTGEIITELSREWRTMPARENSFYIILGKAATKVHRQELPSFGERVRVERDVAEGDGAGDGIGMPGLVPVNGSDRGEIVADRACEVSCDLFLMRCRRLLYSEREKRRYEEKEIEELAEELAHYSNSGDRAAVVAQAFRVMSADRVADVPSAFRQAPSHAEDVTMTSQASEEQILAASS